MIQRPARATLSIFQRKISDHELRAALQTQTVESLGICQGSVLEILVASDVAEKAANVTAAELAGSCPQHITCLALWGDTGAVQAAMNAIREATEQMRMG